MSGPITSDLLDEIFASRESTLKVDIDNLTRNI